MLELVTIDDARQQLRLDDNGTAGGADDAWLAIFIPAISQAVATWLKQEWRLYVPELNPDGTPVLDSAGFPIPEMDSSGLMTVQPIVRAAVLVELASQYRFREGEGENEMRTESGYGYLLCKGATSLLQALRKSTVA